MNLATLVRLSGAVRLPGGLSLDSFALSLGHDDRTIKRWGLEFVVAYGEVAANVRAAAAKADEWELVADCDAFLERLRRIHGEKAVRA